MFQANLIIKKIINRLDLKSSCYVCDYGCGKGGYSKVLAEYFNKVDSVDYYVNPHEMMRNNITCYSQNLLNFRSKTKYDFIFCASVIEHIPKQEQPVFIRNISNNLKEGGKLYLNFPPYLSIIGGHKIAPFHYLPEKAALFFSNKIKKNNIRSYAEMYDTWGLFKTDIQEIEKMLIDNSFKIIDISSRFMPDWYSDLFRYNNFFNWNVEFYSKKNI